MTRKKIVNKSNKLSKDELDPSKDEFVTKSISFLDWAVERRKQIGVLLAVALVASIVAIVYTDMQESKAEELSGALSEGLNAATAPIIETTDETGLPLGGDDDTLSFESEGARATQSIKLLDEAIKNTKGHPVEKVAGLVKANALFEAGEVDKAIAGYRAFIDGGLAQMDWLKANALEGLATALEAKGDVDGAKTAYGKLADIGTGKISLWAKYNEARLAQQKGEDKQQIIQVLTEIVKEIADQGDISKFDYLFTEARSLLLSLNPDADVPELPGGLGGISPEMLQQLMRAQQASGGGGL